MAKYLKIFEFDPRGLPDKFLKTDKQKADYVGAVETELKNTYTITDTWSIAAVIGLLLTDQYFDRTSPSFDVAIRAARDELLKKVPNSAGKTDLAQDVYKYLEAEIPKISR